MELPGYQSKHLLAGKRAVVTGCNRGIGQTILTLFAAEGAEVFACVRRQDPKFEAEVSAIREKYKVPVHIVAFDLEDQTQVAAGARAIMDHKQRIDILVNNAAVIQTGLMQMTTVDTMKRLFEVNFFSQIAFTQTIARNMMRAKSGSIVNLSSSSATEANEGRSAYAASKAALETATKAMARELAPFGIRANAVAPGLTRTQMLTESTAKAAFDVALQSSMLKRVAEPLEIANVAMFLASDLSSFITGQVIHADGGLT